MKLKSSEFKQRNIGIWNEIAPRYHKRWASIGDGPFQSTSKLIQLLRPVKGSRILDIACGTGAVTKMIKEKIGNSGYVIGADSSLTAIKIAKNWIKPSSNLDFINIDAEKFCFSKKFDIVTCQFGLFFFPDAQKALKNIKKSLDEKGILGITVHGKKENVPFFSCILNAILEFIPDFVPKGSPDLDRFGTKKYLFNEVKKAKFSKIIIKDFNFNYSPGKFEDYWVDYQKYVAKPVKEKLFSLPLSKRKELRNRVEQNTLPYTKKNKDIVFPWQILILTAENN